MTTVDVFPAGFRWGVATSAYQIEGSPTADGKTESIWDRFSHAPGRIEDGSTGDTACDHYQRWESDLDLLASLGVTDYRFSISWPRVLPGSTVNEPGLGFYDRLVDGLVARGIRPLATLYHWDLPQALQDQGGWANRDTVSAFASYARVCIERLGDRVSDWCTINEPWIVGVLGSQLGIHAPGHTDPAEAVRVMHHLLLAHGTIARELARTHPGHRAGIAFSLFPHYPISDDPADIAAARLSDGYVNRWFLDPCFGKGYPADMQAEWEKVAGPLDFIRPGDLDLIATASGFIGVNYYTRRVVGSAEPNPFPWKVYGAQEGVPLTNGGWEIVPEAFTDLLVRLKADYGDTPILITENGAISHDTVAPDGHVHDQPRTEFLASHLDALREAIGRGVNVEGYLHWSFMDNFEWAMGYVPRFGLIHVDRDTLTRTVKDSGHFYANVIASNGAIHAC